MEDQVSKKDKVENIQTKSNSESDTYWEQKLPNDYEEILNLSKDSLQWTTKKELYSILRRGFLIDNGQQVYFIGIVRLLSFFQAYFKCNIPTLTYLYGLIVVHC